MSILLYEQRRDTSKKLYNEYILDKRMAISNDDKDECEMAKKVRSDPSSPIASLIHMKPKVLRKRRQTNV